MTTADSDPSSLADINAEIARLTLLAENIRRTQRAGVLARIRAEIRDFELSAEELGFSGPDEAADEADEAMPAPQRRARAAVAAPPAPVRYRHPDGQTWSGGRGRKPRWVAELLAAGADLERYRVAD